EMVHNTFERLLGGTGAAAWTRPEGGYFISVDVHEGCARRIIALAGDAGVKLTPGGATFPYGNDPDDRNIRIAPSYPDLADLEAASEGIALSILLGVSESLLAAAGPGRAARQA
ncbi:MAG: aminotransferase, partial [Alphaproteobacteria bacterium]